MKVGDKYCGWKPEAQHGMSNSGKPWKDEDKKTIVDMFDSGHCLEDICLAIGRSYSPVLDYLARKGRLERDPVSYKFYVKTVKNQTEIEETIMSNANIETKVFIQGKDASDLSDNQIFQAIAKLEVEMASLEKIKNKPKKLQAVLEAMQADIEKLVEYVDAR